MVFTTDKIALIYMKYSEVISLLGETGLSPEVLAKNLSISNSTYRRWLKADPGGEFPREYEPGLATGVYKLLNDKSLSYNSGQVNTFVEGNLPEYFQAAIGQVKDASDMFSENSTHQDKITAVLSSLGNSNIVRDRVDKSSKNILKFAEWGTAWKYRIKLMLKVITSKDMGLIDRMVAYGALFYLILPLDLVPDSIPVFGYVDDFGILGFAAAYYYKRFPDMVSSGDKLTLK